VDIEADVLLLRNIWQEAGREGVAEVAMLATSGPGETLTPERASPRQSSGCRTGHPKT
jgi:hypothetical protein